MFFADNWPTRIERASLNGQDRVGIVYRGLLTVKSLSVDTLKDKLYWADETRQTLEVSDYDGSNRRVIRRLDDKPTDFYYYQVSIPSKQCLSSVLYKNASVYL